MIIGSLKAAGGGRRGLQTVGITEVFFYRSKGGPLVAIVAQDRRRVVVVEDVAKLVLNRSAAPNLACGDNHSSQAIRLVRRKARRALGAL